MTLLITAEERAKRREAAAKAGARGTHAMPLTFGQRFDRYTEQTGRAVMTARQKRRAEKKHRRAVALPF